MEGLLALGIAGVVVSLVLGFRAGMATQHARTAVKTHSTAKEAMPGLRKTARSARFSQVLWFVGTAVASGLLLFLLIQAA